MKEDTSKVIENNNMADEGNELERKMTVSAEARYPHKANIAAVRFTVYALSQVIHNDEPIGNEALKGPIVINERMPLL